MLALGRVRPGLGFTVRPFQQRRKQSREGRGKETTDNPQLNNGSTYISDFTMM
jgi:hypothetical protein